MSLNKIKKQIELVKSQDYDPEGAHGAEDKALWILVDMVCNRTKGTTEAARALKKLREDTKHQPRWCG